MMMEKKPDIRAVSRLFMLSFIMAFLTLLPCTVMSHGMFLWIGDRYMQITYIFRHIHDTVQNGGALWDGLCDLGMDFYGTNLFYGLLSPFMLLSLAVPSSAYVYALLPLEALKIAVGAAGAYLFIRRFTEKDSSAFIGGMLYGFSGLHIDGLQYHFNDATVLFPLLLWAFDMLVREKRRGGFGIMLVICVMTNYYFAFGECVFLLIYYISLIAGREIRFGIRQLAEIIIEGILGLGMACFVLLPAAFTVLGTAKAGDLIFEQDMLSYSIPGTIMYIIRGMFLMPDFNGYLVYNDTRELVNSSCSLYIPFIGMIGVLWAFREGRKKWYARLIVICGVMAAIPLFNSVFSMFNSHYYARWFFMPVLVMCMMCAKFCDGFETAEFRREALVCGAAGIVFSVHILVRQILMSDSIGGFSQNSSRAGLYGVSFVCACASPFILLWLRRTDRSRLRIKKPLTVLTCISCGLLPLFTSLFLCSDLNTEFCEYAWDMSTNAGQGLDTEDEEGFYRTAASSVYSDNMPVVYGCPSLFYFHSNMPSASVSFYDAAGLSERTSVLEISDEGRKDIDLHELYSFLSVKYDLVYNRKNAGGIKVEVRDRGYDIKGFDLYKEDNSYVWFRNRTFIPMGFTYDYYMDIEDITDSGSEVGGGFGSYYKDTEHMDEGTEDGGLPSEDRQRLLLRAIWLDKEQIEKYSGILTELPRELREDRSEEAFLKDCQDRAAHSAVSFEPEGRGFTSRVELDRDELVFYSVSYDEGFTCYVDGEKTDIERVFGGLCAVYVPEGEHEVRFEYFPKGLRAGIAVSGGSLMLFIIYFFGMKKRRQGITNS